MKSFKRILVFVICLFAFSTVFGQLSCPLNPPKGPVLVFEDQFEPGWSVLGTWGSVTATQVQSPGQSQTTEKSLLLHYPIAWGGTGLYESSFSAYIGGRTNLSLRIRKQTGNGDVLIGLHRPSGLSALINVSNYLTPLQSTPFVAGKWYSISIPITDFGPLEPYLQGVVFQSSVVDDVWVDDVTFSTPITLKWPLGQVVRQINGGYHFGDDWVEGSCPSGVYKIHNGVDYVASTGTAVYAAESGVVKETTFTDTVGWAWNIVLEHAAPSGQKYTTVYWHVVPSVSVGPAVIQKGTQIATIADLTPYGHFTHFHFGLRMGIYDANVSGTGALPQNNCGVWPAFPAGFVDPNDTKNVLFQ